MITRQLLPILLALAVPPSLVIAQQETLQIAPDKSEVRFTVPTTLHTVEGTFHVEQNSITIHPSQYTMSGKIVVNALSGDSGDSGRDKKMKGDVLKASQFTAITFVPETYTGILTQTGDSAIVVSGTFTLLGKPHQLSLPMQVDVNHSQLRATGSFVVPYVEWGLKNPGNFLLHVDKQVQIHLVLVGSLAAAANTD